MCLEKKMNSLSRYDDFRTEFFGEPEGDELYGSRLVFPFNTETNIHHIPIMEMGGSAIESVENLWKTVRVLEEVEESIRKEGAVLSIGSIR